MSKRVGFRQVTSVLLALVLLVSLFAVAGVPVSAAATEYHYTFDSTTDGFTYPDYFKENGSNYNNCVVSGIGTKLYIVGANDDALQEALDYFLANFVKDDSGKIPAKYNYYYKPTHVIYTLAGQNIAGYTIRTERYPSLVVQRTVLERCGYILPIKAMNPPPGYTNSDIVYIPEYWMGLYGADVKDFFEVQVVDYTRVYQTSNDDIEYKQAENDIQFTNSFGKVK